MNIDDLPFLAKMGLLVLFVILLIAIKELPRWLLDAY
jgi:hypothetical protein